MIAEKFQILIVDDETTNIKVLVDLLKSDHHLIIARNGQQALKRLEEQTLPDLVLLDVVMPEMDGYEVCRIIKDDERTSHIPIIFITSLDNPNDEERGLEQGALDYITKPFSPPIVKARVRNHLALKRAHDLLERQTEILEDQVRYRTREVAQVQSVAILSLASLAETRDNETGNHLRRTQNYVRVIAERLAKLPQYKTLLTQRTIEMLRESAPLHDIGKVGVPDSILLKPDKLTEEEFEEMKNHTTYGYDALMAAESKMGIESTLFLKFAKEVALSHHEKWDGSGYPKGLSGDDIPLSGRLMAIADVYDALISKRVYKPAFPHEKAMRIIREGRGTHFDPVIVDTFVSVEDEIKEIALSFQDGS